MTILRSFSSVKLLVTVLALFSGATGSLWAGFWGFEGQERQFDGVVWDYRMQFLDAYGYNAGVAKLFDEFEAKTERSLGPGEHGRVALKVYTHSGPGNDTPPKLVQAVIEALVARGFKRENVLVVDLRQDRLREAGYIPPLSARVEDPEFAGASVVALDKGNFFDEAWYYDSPLPREFTSPLAREILGSDALNESPDRRKSFLPRVLLDQVDYWINLPVVTDHPSLGLNGALVNATLWNVSNATRFLASPANGPVAVAEIAAIPELRANWALSLVSLSRYQYIGGPRFHSLYTDGEPRLLMAVDPAILDAVLAEKIGKARARNGFEPLPEVLPMLDFATQLGLGIGLARMAKWEEVE